MSGGLRAEVVYLSPQSSHLSPGGKEEDNA